MIKDISKTMTWHVWMVTYLRRNVTMVCGASYHLLGSRISRDSKIRFWLQVESYISNWQFRESQHLARYVSCHNAMSYDRPMGRCGTKIVGCRCPTRGERGQSRWRVGRQWSILVVLCCVLWVVGSRAEYWNESSTSVKRQIQISRRQDAFSM